MKVRALKTLVLMLCLLSISASARQIDNDQLIDLQQGQRYKEAAAYIRSVFPGAITDLKIISRLAYYDYMSGKLAAAENGYATVLRADSANRTALNYLALINEQRLNYPKSRAIFEKLLTIDSLNPTTYVKLARIAEFQRDTASVVNYLTKANNLDPDNPDVGVDLALLLIKKKIYGRADTILGIAIKADPYNIALMEVQARLAIEIHNYKDASRYALQAIKGGSVSGEIINILGQAQYYTKHYKECIATYAVFEGSALANETTYYYTALSFRQLGDLKKSNEYLYKSIADGISYSVPIYYQELSINDEKLKRYRTSISLLNKAEEFSAKNVFNYSRARIYDFNLADPNNALKFYKRYVKNYDPIVDKDEECYSYSQLRIKELTEKSTAKQ